MLDKKSIVILYSKGRYDNTALAIADKLGKLYKDVYVIDIDNESISPWKYATLGRKMYVFSERNAPFINAFRAKWQSLFAHIGIGKTKKDYKEMKIAEDGLKKWIYTIKSKYRRVYNVLTRFEPDVVLCTTPELAAKANKAKANLGQYNCSVAAIITDYALDNRFVHFKTDVFFTQNKEIMQQLIEFGIDKDAVCVTGTPIESGKEREYDPYEVMTELGITRTDLNNILVVSGRYGGTHIKNIAARLIDGVEDYNLIIMTGGSTSLSHYAEYVAKSGKTTDNIYFIEHIDDMAKLYSIADVVIAKPTAQITYEVMTHGKPLILIKGSTNIERANAHYLANNGVALTGNSPNEAVASLLKYLEDKDFTAQVIAKQRELAPDNVAEVIAEQLYELMNLHFINKLEVERKRLQIMNNDNPKYTGKGLKKPVNVDAMVKEIKTEVTVESEGNKEAGADTDEIGDSADGVSITTEQTEAAAIEADKL